MRRPSDQGRAPRLTTAAGMSLVELVVAMGISAVLIAAIASYMQQTAKFSAANESKVTAQQEAAQVLAMLTKDLTYINRQVAQPVIANGPQVSLDTTTTDLVYRSVCVAAPKKLAALNYSASLPAGAGCLPGGGCPVGQMPALQITKAGGQAPETFPRLLKAGGGSDAASVGAMACFAKTAAGLTVNLFHFYLDVGGLVRPLSRQAVLPIGNVAGVNIIRD